MAEESFVISNRRTLFRCLFGVLPDPLRTPLGDGPVSLLPALQVDEAAYMIKANLLGLFD